MANLSRDISIEGLEDEYGDEGEHAGVDDIKADPMNNSVYRMEEDNTMSPIDNEAGRSSVIMKAPSRDAPAGSQNKAKSAAAGGGALGLGVGGKKMVGALASSFKKMLGGIMTPQKSTEESSNESRNKEMAPLDLESQDRSKGFQKFADTQK